MLVVIASDKFKGSLTGAQVADAVREGLGRQIPNLRTRVVPVADGGEGTLAAALDAGFSARELTVAGPTGEPVRGSIGLRGEIAVVELATASGLDLLPGGIKDARGATSYGTGELIVAALDANAKEIILGVGGSACTDGGAGMLQALGVKLLDAQGNELPRGGGALSTLARVDLNGLDSRLGHIKVILAADVDNPLTGSNGAAAVFGPQKGASAVDVEHLDAALANFAHVLGQCMGNALSEVDGAIAVAAHARASGAGAAGGVGFAALAVLGATRQRGIEVVLELTGLAAALEGADAVITGEGSLDRQSLEGKTPIGVAELAATHGVPVYAICGRTLLGAQELSAAGFSKVVALQELEPDLNRSMANAAALITDAAELLAPAILTNASFSAVTSAG
ncbi:glycerate kinase [Arthrobacter sp. MYb227]|uniref:glycerate kinase n=1 Tax=Arthrobacter sp. MYb227 TaxID=1848601 RepID=UPI000CFD1078|nr:glycerate kinase [Arthrobacter sp. MYb227]PQZ94622.1 glycerate kinase [Arthrobacter sp. MYb227]